jgi:hypothetical protein
MSPPIEDWARAFLATQVIEVPIVAGWLRGPLPLAEAAALGVLASSLTHPLLWYAWPRFSPAWLQMGAGEALVWTAEAALYALWLRRAGAARPWRQGLVVSCLANGSSMLAGMLLWF